MMTVPQKAQLTFDHDLVLTYSGNLSQQIYLQDMLLASTSLNLRICRPIDVSFQSETYLSQSVTQAIVEEPFLVTVTKLQSGTTDAPE